MDSVKIEKVRSLLKEVDAILLDMAKPTEDPDETPFEFAAKLEKKYVEKVVEKSPKSEGNICVVCGMPVFESTAEKCRQQGKPVMHPKCER